MNKIKKNPQGKPLSVFAVDKETFEFIGVYPSGSQAGKILFDDTTLSPSILKCARGLQKYVKGYTFTLIDLNEPFTADTIKEKIEEIKMRSSKKSRMLFTLEMIKKMEEGEHQKLKELYDKYKNGVDNQVES